MTAKTYNIGGMDCAGCAREVETGVGKLKGVERVQVDFPTAKMHLQGDVPFETLRQRVEALGKTIENPGETKPERTGQALSLRSGGVIGFVRYLAKRGETRLALAGGGLILLTLVAALLGASDSITSVLYIVATVIALLPIARSGVNTLLINRDFNINLLMTIAAIGAIFIGETLEAATVVFLFAVGEALEGYTADRARDSLRGLMALAPGVAVRLTVKEGLRTKDLGLSEGGQEVTSYQLPVVNEGQRQGLRTKDLGLSESGQEVTSYQLPVAREEVQSTEYKVQSENLLSIPIVGEEVVPVEALRVGDVILVKPGERAPMDGEVVSGESGVNQAPITGESMPVRKSVGSDVFAGSINGDGALTVRVTRLAADNTLSRIIRLVEEAQSVRAPSQRLIDQFARYYTPGVVVLAALVALVPPLLFNAPFYNPVDGTQGWLYRALELLVIACPCSLVISTPVTIISAITAAARRGVLIKGGAHLESLGSIKAVAFDKTGTLTRGEPRVTAIRSVDCETGEKCELCDDVLALASSVERGSAHPLAKSVVQAAHARGLDAIYAPAEAVEALAGRGVQGRVGGRLVTVGSHGLFESEHPHDKEICDWVDAAEAQGQTTMLLSDGDRVRGYIAVADEARDESRTVIHELQMMGIQTVMLTGDNPAVAKNVGQVVGVDDVRARLLPADKVDAVKGLLGQYGAVGMVGDGVNDTPALAAATVGVAMGGAGSAQALETADVALMADDLTQLPYAIKLSRFARMLIRQNIVVSLGLKLVFVLLALAGGASLWLAVFADVGMSLIVTLNGMRPLRYRTED